MTPCDVVILAIEKIDWLRELEGHLPVAIVDVYDLLREAHEDNACDSWPAFEFAERILAVDWPYDITE